MRLFKAKVHGRLNILTTHRKARARARTTPRPIKHLKKVAEVPRAAPAPEQVTEVNVHAFPARRRGKISPCLPVFAELVIALALVRIGEDGVGFAYLLE